MGLGPATLCVWPGRSGRVVPPGAEAAVGLRERGPAGPRSGPDAASRCAELGYVISSPCVQRSSSQSSSRNRRLALSLRDGREGARLFQPRPTKTSLRVSVPPAAPGPDRTSTGDPGPSRIPTRQAAGNTPISPQASHPREGEEERLRPPCPDSKGFLFMG